MRMRCNSVQAATGLAMSRMAVWYYSFVKLGSNYMTVGLDICYAFNTILHLAQVQQLQMKSHSVGMAFVGPLEVDAHIARR